MYEEKLNPSLILHTFKSFHSLYFVLFICGGGTPGGTSVVIVSLSEAPGFAVLRPALTKGGDTALISAQRGDDAFLKLVFGLRRQRQRLRRCAGALFYLRELQVHAGAAEGDPC